MFNFPIYLSFKILYTECYIMFIIITTHNYKMQLNITLCFILKIHVCSELFLRKKSVQLLSLTPSASSPDVSSPILLAL